MKNLNQKILTKALSIGILLSSSLLIEGFNLVNIEAKLSSMDKTAFETIKRGAEDYEKSISTSESTAENNQDVKRGLIHLGKDNAGQPIQLSYLYAGNKNKCKGTIVCVDNLLGSEGYRKQLKKWAKQNFFVLAFDLLGAGLSTQNDPVAMDGIGNFEGYSLHQFAYLFREALMKLNVQPNTAATPIAFTGLDFSATIGLSWAYLYPNDQYGLSFYIPENSNLSAITTDDPCTSGVLTPAVAEILSQLYAADPCGILCSLYAGDPASGLPGLFTEKNCADYGNLLYFESIKYGSITPASIFERQLTRTLAFNPAPLMQNINIPVLMLNGGAYQVLNHKQQHVIGLYGICYACNPPCTSTTYIMPFPNSIALYYQDAGIALHATRTKRFNKDVANFITGKAGKCDPYLKLNVNVKSACNPCPGPAAA